MPQDTYNTFKFRTGRDGEIRQMITGIAQKMQRNESDAMRVVVREVARGLGVTPSTDSGKQTSTEDVSGKRAAT